MNKTAQVSASIAETTKEELDRFTEEFGLKKNYVVEQALRFFMAARRELPDEAFVPTRVVVGNAGLKRLDSLLSSDAAPPTDALRELMSGTSD